MPIVDNDGTVTIPVADAILNANPYAVLNCNAPPTEEESPTFVAPICKDGTAADPIGNNKLPVNVPPVNAKFNEACPVTDPIKFAVTVPAEKLPDPSLETMAFAVFALVAVVAVLDTKPT